MQDRAKKEDQTQRKTNQKSQKEDTKQQSKKCIVQQLRNGYRKYTFSKESFIVDNQYQLQRIKGSGSYGVVAAGRHLPSGNQVAVKKVWKVFQYIEDTRRTLREIKILKFLKHRNIISLRDMMSINDYQQFTDVYLVMDYMKYNLHQLIRSPTSAITQPMIQFILYQLLSALHYMHSADIIHRDLKPQNILLNDKCALKIADMNLARKQTQKNFTYYVTTRPYRAPQIFITQSYTRAIDIWSVGCILAQMLGRTVLFQAKDYTQQLKKFVAILGKPPLSAFEGLDGVNGQSLARTFKDVPDCGRIDWRYLFPNASAKALDLLDHMLVYDARRRYTAEQCLDSPFLEEFRNKPRPLSKETFDFSFDDIDPTPQNLRKALFEEVQEFTCKKKKEREPIKDAECFLLDPLAKKIKTLNNASQRQKQCKNDRLQFQQKQKNQHMKIKDESKMEQKQK